ncbi:hypothetical protein BDW02DRAFT_573596 [Decorospora gaudefroyi]|uniref:Uncharacterized protein n=1 Tax=Decorospora gaudefroyi TaxID=184978 RepID=A0A6A5JZB4_9PLEO|nr:hypothetical protein BDW02DRAFT_573596 [Decorospora gaudefroyi]
MAKPSAPSYGQFDPMDKTVESLLAESRQLNKDLTELANKRNTSHTRQSDRRKREQLLKVEMKIHDSLASYSKPQCQSICDDVCNRLPREVRDMIYSFTHEHETIYVGPEYLLRTSTQRPCEADRDAHYWDAEYMGVQTQREMVESWYRTTLFYFYDKAHNASVVEQFLVLDRWGLHVKPRDFICRVRFELSAGSVLHGQGDSYPNGPRITCCAMQNVGQRLVEPIQNLHLLPNHVHFFIRIHTYGALQTGCIPKDELSSTVGIIVRRLKELRAAGHRFVVQWPDLGEFELSSGSGTHSPDDWTKRLEDAAELVRCTRARKGSDFSM